MENLPGLQQAYFQYCANPSLCWKLTEFKFHILLPGIKGVRVCTAVKGLQQTVTDTVFFCRREGKALNQPSGQGLQTSAGSLGTEGCQGGQGQGGWPWRSSQAGGEARVAGMHVTSDSSWCVFVRCSLAWLDHCKHSHAHACTHTCMHTPPHIHTEWHAHTYIHTCMHAHMHTCARTHTHKYAYWHTHTRTLTLTHTHTHTHACTLTHTPACIHTHTQTHARIWRHTHTLSVG